MNTKFRRSKVATAVACITGAGAFTTAAMPAHAADVMVEVTGSHIKSALTEGALPVQTITREEIAKSGVQTAYDILERISATMGYGSFPEPFSLRNFMSQGSAAVSMRGLGIDKTLVLLNGRRIANYALSRGFPGVDLNAIPISVIERVEVLKDGASAIYGTDAIAGVINFITRKDFTGAEISGYYSSPQQGGGEEIRATLTAGRGDLSVDKFNAWFAYDYLDRKDLLSRERSFSNTAYRPEIGLDRTSNQTFPANIVIPGTNLIRNPTDPNAPGVASPVCNPPQSFPSPNPFFPHECRSDSDQGNENMTIHPSTRQNLFGHVTWQIRPELQFFGEAAYSRNQFAAYLSGQGVNQATRRPDGAAGGIMLPATSPYYPTAWLQANYPDAVGKPISVLWTIVDNGLRDTYVLSQQQRVVAGIKGTVKDWDYEAALNYNRNQVEESVRTGTLDRRIFIPLVDSGVVNPFGPNTPDVIAQIKAATINQVWQSAHGAVRSIDFKTSGHVAALPAGPLSVALGGEYRIEDLTQWHAPILESFDVLAGSTMYTTAPPADRKVSSIFAETYIPIVNSVEAQVALRFDHYSDFGSTTNPKLALRWQPIKQILLRGSWSQGFHAPSLVELYQPQFETSALGVRPDDPLRCDVTQTLVDCNTGFRVKKGGNPQLRPETSDQWSLGLVLDPVEGVSIGFDWFRIDVHDLIGQRTDSFLAAQMNDPNSPYVVRGPVDPLYPALPGPVLYFRGQALNLQRKRVEGVDVDLSARSPSLPFGRLSAKLNGTYLISYNESKEDGSFPDIVGTRGDAGAIPRWKHVLSFDWAQGPWSASLIEYYTHSYTEPCIIATRAQPLADPSGCTTRTVGAYEIWDLSAGYTGFKNTTLRVGVKNILNRDPPVSNQTLSLPFWTGFDPTSTDPRGRTYWASVRYTFK